MSEELIDEVITRYYKIVSEKLGKLEHHTLNIYNLGTFQVKEKSLIDKIKHYKNALAVYEKELANEESKMSMRRYEAMMTIKNDIENFERILGMLNQEKKRKEQKLEEKLNFNSENNESDKNLEIKESDS